MTELSEEEKEAIEILENFEPDDLIECSIYLKALDIIKNLIQKQDTEINKLKNVIDRMVKHIVEQTYKDLEECEFEDKYNINCNSSKRTCEDCIKEYFMNMKEDK